MSKSPVFYAIPFFFLLIFIELIYFYFKKQKVYRLNDTITNLSLGIGNQVTNALTKSILFGLIIWVHQHFALFHIKHNVWSFLVCFIAYDFIYYWSHRWGHTVSLFWGAHIVHHQSEEYNLSVALRQSWFHNLLAFYLFLPLPLLGFEPLTIGIAGAVNLLYQFWIHTEAIKRMPKWFEFIFNSPSHHRVHHGVNPHYIDKNHAGVLIIWDKLFGTFQEEDESTKIKYGITTPLSSWNPAWANFHFYAELFEKMKQANGFWNKTKLIFLKPGFNPKTNKEDNIPEPNNAIPKYDKQSSTLKNVYALFQFVIVVIGAIMYLGNFSDLSLAYKLLFSFSIFFSIEIIGGIFEEKDWASFSEFIRLVVIGLIINVFYYSHYQNFFNLTLSISIILFSISFFSFFYIRNDAKTSMV